MESSNGHVPIIGGPKVRIGASVGAIPRKLDENGTYEAAKTVQGPNGQPIGISARSDFVDAEELVAWLSESVRVIVREELERAMGGEKGK